MNDMEQKKYRYICVDGSGQCRVPLPYAYPADVSVPEMRDVGSRLLYEAFPRVKYHKEYSQFRIEIEELPSEKSPVSPEEDGLQFLQELRAAQKPLREAPANNAELDKAVDAIKDALRKYVADPMNCLSNTCGLELEDNLEVGKVAVYMGSDRGHPSLNYSSRYNYKIYTLQCEHCGEVRMVTDDELTKRVLRTLLGC